MNECAHGRPLDVTGGVCSVAGLALSNSISGAFCHVAVTWQSGSGLTSLVDTEHAAVVFCEASCPATILSPLAIGRSGAKGSFEFVLPVDGARGAEQAP